ncbi:MAG: HPP family protein [Gracilimonas sp.]|nr:HPP family protein [Gracilimonas sp.]
MKNIFQKIHWVPPRKWGHGQRWMLIIDALNALLSMAIVGGLALVFREPMLFPSLGATAYVLFAHPHEHQGQFKNTFFSHLMAAFIGWATFYLVAIKMGGDHQVNVLDIFQTGTLQSQMDGIWLYVASPAIATGLTLAAMVATHTEHSPAASTTLVFALGIFQHAWQIGIVMVGVTILLICGAVLNRLAGFEPESIKHNKEARIKGDHSNKT